MYRTTKIISILFVTVIAFFGIKKDFTKDDNLTKWGFVIAGVTMLSSITAIVIEILDHKKQIKNDKETNKKFENLKFQLSKPILPLSVSLILKHTPNVKIVEEVFGERIKEFESITSKLKENERFISKDTLLFPYDEKDESKYSLIRLSEDEFSNLMQDEKNKIKFLLRYPFSLELEIYQQCKSEPEITFRAGNTEELKVPKFFIEDLRLYNKNLYQKMKTPDWRILKNTNSILSIYDLRNCKIILKTIFYSFDKTEIDNPPYFTEICFVSGNKPYTIIKFNKDNLGIPKISNPFGKNEDIKDELYNLIGNPIMLTYEFIVPFENFDTLVQQIN